MVSIVERYAAALLGFGFVFAALTAGITTALLAGAGAAAACGLAVLRQRRRLDRFSEHFMDERAAERRNSSKAHQRNHARSRTRRAA